MDAGEDITRIEEAIAITAGLNVGVAVTALVEAEAGALLVGGDDMEAFGA